MAALGRARFGSSRSLRLTFNQRVLGSPNLNGKDMSGSGIGGSSVTILRASSPWSCSNMARRVLLGRRANLLRALEPDLVGSISQSPYAQIAGRHASDQHRHYSATRSIAQTGCAAFCIQTSGSRSTQRWRPGPDRSCRPTGSRPARPPPPTSRTPTMISNASPFTCS